MDEIAEWMKETSVTQAAAADVLHVTRSRVSEWTSWQLRHSTLDRRHGLKYRLYFGHGGKCLVRCDTRCAKTITDL